MPALSSFGLFISAITLPMNRPSCTCGDGRNGLLLSARAGAPAAAAGRTASQRRAMAAPRLGRPARPLTLPRAPHCCRNAECGRGTAGGGRPSAGCAHLHGPVVQHVLHATAASAAGPIGLFRLRLAAQLLRRRLYRLLGRVHQIQLLRGEIGAVRILRQRVERSLPDCLAKGHFGDARRGGRLHRARQRELRRVRHAGRAMRRAGGRAAAWAVCSSTVRHRYATAAGLPVPCGGGCAAAPQPHVSEPPTQQPPQPLPHTLPR